MAGCGPRSLSAAPRSGPAGLPGAAASPLHPLSPSAFHLSSPHPLPLTHPGRGGAVPGPAQRSARTHGRSARHPRPVPGGVSSLGRAPVPAGVGAAAQSPVRPRSAPSRCGQSPATAAAAARSRSPGDRRLQELSKHRHSGYFRKDCVYSFQKFSTPRGQHEHFLIQLNLHEHAYLRHILLLPDAYLYK